MKALGCTHKPEFQAFIEAALDEQGVFVIWTGLGLDRSVAAESARRICGLMPPGLATRVWISRSATRGAACVAMTTIGPIGVDVEAETDLSDIPGLDGGLAGWCLREAVGKALGTGLSVLLEPSAPAPNPWTWTRCVPLPGRVIHSRGLEPPADGIHGVISVASLAVPENLKSGLWLDESEAGASPLTDTLASRQ